MNRRHGLLVLLAVGLLTANLIHWWSSQDERLTIPSATGGSERFQTKDFQLQSMEGEGAKPPQRDPFRPRVSVTHSNKASPPQPSKTPAEIAEEAARTELAQYRVVGVVFRNGRGHAYLVRGSENFLVSSGDKVGGYFMVVSITSEAVQLRDPQTEISGRLPVMGY
jgi:Tfp pilus assembly protein PilP